MPGTVSVACKLPHGLHLNVFNMKTVKEQTRDGSLREVDVAVHSGRVTIEGTRRRFDDPRISFGYAVTHGVDADHWARWLEQNKDSDLVKNRIVFAQPDAAKLEGQARNNEKARSGLEEVDPGALPAEFRKIKTADKKD